MLTTKRRALIGWLPPAAPARQDLETVPLKLTARVVARRIRDFLDGRWTRSQLQDWAVGQFVRQDFSHWFEPCQSKVLRDAIAALIPMDQALDAARERVTLEALADGLESEP